MEWKERCEAAEAECARLEAKLKRYRPGFVRDLVGMVWRLGVLVVVAVAAVAVAEAWDEKCVQDCPEAPMQCPDLRQYSVIGDQLSLDCYLPWAESWPLLEYMQGNANSKIGDLESIVLKQKKTTADLFKWNADRARFFEHALLESRNRFEKTTAMYDELASKTRGKMDLTSFHTAQVTLITKLVLVFWRGILNFTLFSWISPLTRTLKGITALMWGICCGAALIAEWWSWSLLLFCNCLMETVLIAAQKE